MGQVHSKQPGYVYFVGAGPGDPDLISVRGAELLQCADVVIYDYLVNPLLLVQLRPDVRTICLGRHGKGRIMPQEDINRLLVSLAGEGANVVRLKSGDPVVFGRLAEEISSLDEAGIRFEIVPGITAALAAPSFAGVPVTHRDKASAVALVTGQECSASDASKLDYAALAKFPGTLVFYMGVTSAAAWSGALMKAGRDPATPAVIVRRCGWTDQESIPCTLGTVADEITCRKLRPPAIVLVGDACGVESTMAWAARRPLFGQTILVTRPVHQSLALCRKLGQLGAGCLVQPAIAIEDPSDWAPVDRAIEQLSTYDWLVFSSANGVQKTLDRLYQRHGDLRLLGSLKIAVIGPRTAEELGRYHLKPDITPEAYRAEALAAALGPAAAGRRFLLARASRGRDLLAAELAAAGGQVEQVVVYESRDVVAPEEEVADALAEGRIDWVTVTSSAIARSLAAMFGEQLQRTRLASISPVTTATLRECGLEPAVEAQIYTSDGLADALVRTVRDERTKS